MMRFAFPLCLCLAAAASAAIDGTVTNRTTGKPQAGATVTLFKITQNGPESLESVKSDAAGKFHIETATDFFKFVHSFCAPDSKARFRYYRNA